MKSQKAVVGWEQENEASAQGRLAETQRQGELLKKKKKKKREPERTGHTERLPQPACWVQVQVQVQKQVYARVQVRVYLCQEPLKDLRHQHQELRRESSEARSQRLREREGRC